MKALFSKIIPYVTVLLAMLAWAFGSVLYKETLIAWWEPLLDGSYTRYCNSVFRKKMAMANSFR